MAFNIDLGLRPRAGNLGQAAFGSVDRRSAAKYHPGPRMSSMILGAVMVGVMAWR